MNRMPAILALVLALLPAVAEAEDMVCIPEYYYNSDEIPPLVIPIDPPRLEGSLVTRVDLETGAYRELRGSADGDEYRSGTLTIIDRGSMQERIDFVALEPKSGLLIRISTVDSDLPFVRLDEEGSVASGHCISEWQLPK